MTVALEECAEQPASFLENQGLSCLQDFPRWAEAPSKIREHDFLEEETKSAMSRVRSIAGAVEKHVWLVELSRMKPRVFHSVLVENLAELLPIVYTPTIGAACLRFSQLFSEPPGQYVSAFDHRGHVRQVIDGWPHDAVDLVVVTDGGRILGLGDLGTNGLGIACGKVSLHVAGAGLRPSGVVPVCLDCGTENLTLRSDPSYAGKRAARIRGRDHLEFVSEFCCAVQDKWPSCLIHFEDFKTEEAYAILENLRHEVFCYNDDIQGTAAVTVAGILNGMKIQRTDYRDLRVLFFGAGSSACGVAHMLASLIQEESSLTKQEAYNAIYMMDVDGLLTNTRGDTLPSHNACFARCDGCPDMRNLLEIVKYVKPHALIGLSGAGPSFDEDVVREMCRHSARPLIFPLSNPTCKAEITAEEAYQWSSGRCLFAAGSPFAPVEYNGRTYLNGQANNVFIFPGIAFGSVAIKAKRVTDEMFMTAARTLADSVTAKEIQKGLLYPDVKHLRKISLRIAAAVAQKAIETRIAAAEVPAGDYSTFLEEKIWKI